MMAGCKLSKVAAGTVAHKEVDYSVDSRADRISSLLLRKRVRHCHFLSPMSCLDHGT
jgi:hypothetical protein